MTLPHTTGHPKAASRAIPGYTLIELVLVMGLLALVMAMSAPSLTRYFQERALEQEAARWLAVSEYARSEAISQGIPMRVWMNTEGKRYGVEPGIGYPVRPESVREYALHRDVTLTVEATTGVGDGTIELLVVSPDGTLTPESLQVVILEDRRGSQLALTQTTNYWAYAIETDLSALH